MQNLVLPSDVPTCHFIIEQLMGQYLRQCQRAAEAELAFESMNRVLNEQAKAKRAEVVDEPADV